MERLAAQRRVAGEAALGHHVHAVLERRRAEHAEFGGQVVGKPFDDDRVGAERHVRAMLLAGPDGHDEPRVELDDRGDVVGAHLLDAARPRRRSRVRLSHIAAVKSTSWIAGFAVALLALSRWLSATSVGYLLVAATATAVAAAFVIGARSPDRRWAVSCAAGLTLALVLAANTQTQLARLARAWPAERRRIADEALQQLSREVDVESARLESLAHQALGAP